MRQDHYLLVILRWKDFKGRSNRSEFWSFKFIDIVISNIIYLLIYYITYPLVISCLIGMGVVYYLFTFVPYLFLIIRRLHDAGWSGKWCILPLILEVHFVISDIYPSFYQIIAALKPTSLILVLLLYLVILVVISLLIAVFIVILFLKGDKGENQYGLPPTNYFMISSTIPKGRVTNLEVIYNGPEQRYSIAKMNWNGLENCYAIRWNFAIKSWIMFPKKLANYIDFELFLNEKELYSIISEKIIAAVKQQRQINPSLFSLSVSYNTKEIDPIIIQEIKKILSLENITLISVNTNVEMTVFNVAYT